MALGYDAAFSDTQLKIGQKLITKLWNAFRFVSMHLDGDYQYNLMLINLGMVMAYS